MPDDDKEIGLSNEPVADEDEEMELSNEQVPDDDEEIELSKEQAPNKDKKLELSKEQTSNEDKDEAFGLGEGEADWYLYWTENETLPPRTPGGAGPNSPTKD